MAKYFAELDENKVVKRVIVADQSFIDSGKVGDPKNWVETFYNAEQRKKYTGIGDTYDRNLDAFIPPRPYDSWILDEETAKWKAPKEYPEDDKESEWYKWDESKLDWIERKTL